MVLIEKGMDYKDSFYFLGLTCVSYVFIFISTGIGIV